MKKWFQLTFVVLMWFGASAQSDTIIFYKYSVDVTRDSATWYRDIHFAGSGRGWCTATDYYINGTVKRSGGKYVIDQWKRFCPDGAFINYDENGRKASEGAYVYDTANNLYGNRKGKWLEYYQNGQAKWEYFYEGINKDNYDDELVESFWDSTGKKLLSNGNGGFTFEGLAAPGVDTMSAITVKSIYKNGRLDGNHIITFKTTGKLYATEEYKAGKLIKGTSYDYAGNKYTYDNEEVRAEFPGGDAGLMKFLQKHITYPNYERDNDIQGKVVLNFLIDTTGLVKNVRVLRSVSKGLDKESVWVVEQMMPRFIPARRKGQLIEQYFNLPVVYRLQ